MYLNCLANVFFFFILFVLRDIQDDFNISGELRKVIFISAIALQFYTFSLIFLSGSGFVVYGYCQYILLFMSLALLYNTSLVPILKTYNPSKGILPYALSTDLIKSMESAVTQPLPSNAFYDFLTFDLEDSTGL